MSEVDQVLPEHQLTEVRPGCTYAVVIPKISPDAARRLKEQWDAAGTGARLLVVGS